MAVSPFVNQQIAEINVTHPVFTLPNVSATTTVQAKANVDWLIARITDTEPGMKLALNLDSMGHPAMLSIAALLRKVSASIV